MSNPHSGQTTSNLDELIERDLMRESDIGGEVRQINEA
jgi:hypothetical protein